MKVMADRQVCVGGGMCALMAPAVFEQDPRDGRVIVRQAHPVGEDADAARHAVDMCPSAALSADAG